MRTNCAECVARPICLTINFTLKGTRACYETWTNNYRNKERFEEKVKEEGILQQLYLFPEMEI